ncbi:cytochrome P450 4C1-like [Leptopilina heterotoma]|uniref:cytochrome P450 4C1-like n=1 Tax=Leptopilina heterotoma TaxID=63436 RepID=UPI001CAA1318|nr:cytochrome P450 4C1-like [Leptopilina heterotoma]
MTPFMMFILTVIAIAVIRIIIQVFKFFKFCADVNKLPGPARYPLPTVAFQVRKLKQEDRFKWVFDLLAKYQKGFMMNIMQFNEALVHIYNPRHMEIIFPSTENIKKSFAYDNLNPWLGQGLLTSSGQTWFHQRKLITPAFHFGVVDQFAEVMSEKSRVLTEIIDETLRENPNEPIDIFKLIIRCALDIICETAMGVNMNVQRKYDTDYMNALHKVAQSLVERVNYPWLKWDWIFYRTKGGKETKVAFETMIDFTMKIIKKKKLARQSGVNEPKEIESDEFGKRKRKAFLDLLLDVNENEKNPMTEAEIREQVDTFMFAGHDTTAAAINWAIFNLGNNPEVQEKVHQELDEYFGDDYDRPITIKDVAELKYLDRVIKETLRMHPSVPQISRRLTEDIKLDGYMVPKGVNLAIAIYHLHHNPNVWPNPEKFDPDRFLPENSRGRHPYAYVPFSAGPRNCIGQKFAVAEQKIVLTSILRKWRVKSARTPEEMKLISSFILRPHDGNPVYFIPK